MTTTITHTTAWWLERLDAVSTMGDGYMGRCPAHDDANPSLSITPRGNQSPLVNCFAGCTYGEILDALEDGETIPVITRKNQGKTGKKPQPRSWWEGYTCIEASLWESWGVRFSDDEVIFFWEGIPAEKHRVVQSKEFFWTPAGCATPPFWPKLPDVIPHRLYLSEGESDLGVLRYLGFPAYAMMKGIEGLKKSTSVWFALKQRGCSEVVFVVDLEEKSEEAVEEYVRHARTVGLRTFVLRLNQVVDPLLGEKDLRDAWTRVRHRSLRTTLEDNIFMVGDLTQHRVDLLTFMRTEVADMHWIVDGILLQQTVGMIVGAPKLGKTWLAHDLGLSIASGRPFLGTFEVMQKGPVVYISKEDPDYLLKDRFAKVLEAKGLAGSVTSDLTVTFPPNEEIPFYIDLGREFSFTDQVQVDALLDWLRVIKAHCGYLQAVIFDPVLRMIANADEFKATEVNAAVFTPCERIRKELGTSVVLVHHKGKGPQGEKSSYGSIAFHAFSEGTQYLIGDEPDQDGWVHVRSEFKSAPEQAWAYRFNELEERYDVEVHQGIKPPSRRDVTRDLILLALKGGVQLSVKDLAQDVECSEQMVRDVLKVLEAEGEVQRIDDGGTKVRGGRPRDVWALIPDIQVRTVGRPQAE